MQTSKPLPQTKNAANLEQRLRDAIAQEQLTLHFQPLHSAQGELLAFEALCRWTDEVFGVVPPVQFIALAEQLGLMPTLGAWVLNEACRQGAWLQPASHEILICVNIAASQLTQTDLVEQVHRALLASGLPSQALRLEVGEQTIVDARTSLAHLYDLRTLGVQIAIENFGNAHSHFRRLLDMPVNALKLDRSLVQNIDVDPQMQTLIEGIVRLAHSLGKQVIAVGVETEPERQTLEALGCDAMQGFVFSRPDPIFDAMAYLAEHQLYADHI